MFSITGLKLASVFTVQSFRYDGSVVHNLMQYYQPEKNIRLLALHSRPPLSRKPLTTRGIIDKK